MIAQEWQGVPASVAYEAGGRVGDMSPAIRAMVPGVLVAGPAFTVRCPVGDWRAAAVAVDRAEAGSVLVIDVGDTERATGWGGVVSRYAQARGIAGAVTNGSVRDIAEVRNLHFPVFARGPSVRGAGRSYPGACGGEICVGGVAVHPGDIVVGDDDGVVVVAAEASDRILQRVKELLVRERRLLEGVDSADSYLGLVDS